ncbi:hypothetical protein PILCRDRAFT_741398 [Piloderma croceum F 1598]|uniref:Uncharacterized protein n=1 Tax=Piloderma croceum (strain F 1598) TaxID=765440 RepID=A0A0C3EIF0_PILCF|nr:hypothetical protein PILCRDRAFT_741398 [Piloderma croceum F 1598]
MGKLAQRGRASKVMNNSFYICLPAPVGGILRVEDVGIQVNRACSFKYNHHRHRWAGSLQGWTAVPFARCKTIDGRLPDSSQRDLPELNLSLPSPTPTPLPRPFE